jgi:hypothetical protein
MNCDLAFELMTDAHGFESRALHEHLGQCPRCRQMQGTLAPALEWLADRVSADEPALSPQGRAEVESPTRATAAATAESVDVALSAAESLSERTMPSRERIRRKVAVAIRYASACALGACLAIWVMIPRTPAPGDVRGVAVCRRDEARGSSATSRPAAEIESLVASCVACHGQSQPRDARPEKASDRSAFWLDRLLPGVRADGLFAIARMGYNPAPRRGPGLSNLVAVSALFNDADCFLRRSERFGFRTDRAAATGLRARLRTLRAA